MDPLHAILIVAGITFQIFLLVLFVRLCGDVHKLAEKFCFEEKPEIIDEPVAVYEIGQHVIGDGIELVIAERCGYYYKCNRADTQEFYKVMPAHHLEPMPQS